MEITLILSALGLGLASGFHCIGMCGPIALSMGFTKQSKFHLQNTSYNLGRIVTYTLLGATVGILGKGFEMAGFQKYLTISVGIALIAMALFSFGGNDFASKIPFLNQALMQVKRSLGKQLQKSGLSSRFFTGILNGFLPCGMVYMALTASLAAGGILQSALFMALFGLGTFPFMFAVVLAGNLMGQTFRFKLLKVIPFLMIVLGGLFVLRGMELGIPYLSPKEEVLKLKYDAPKNQHQNEHSSCH